MKHLFNLNDVLGLIQNPVFLSGLVSWFVSQFIKTIVELLKGKIDNFFELGELLLWRTGGMPSSHSALATSLATSIAIYVGLNSELFVVTGFFALVIIRDALGVRRASGIHAQVLNNLGVEVSKVNDIPFSPVKEIHGHTPIEVIIGMSLGMIVSIIFCASYI